MTDKQKQRLRIYKREKGRCKICGIFFRDTGATFSRAHIIKDHKMYRRKYGDEVIDHDLNVVATCYKCNGKVDLGHKDELIRQHAEMIIKKIAEDVNNV
jgi:5-methylcytosine-specific restriction endonuclease McrA